MSVHFLQHTPPEGTSSQNSVLFCTLDHGVGEPGALYGYKCSLVAFCAEDTKIPLRCAIHARWSIGGL